MNTLFDGDGLIYKLEQDGSLGYGDSCCQTMRYHHLLFVRKKMGIDNPTSLPFSLDSDLLRAYLKYLDHDDQLIRAPRHLLPPEWTDPVKDFSRDQHDPLLMAMGRQSPIFQIIIKNQIRAFQMRHWFYQNKDTPIPQTFAILRRAQRQDSSNWFDAGLWGSALSRCGFLPKWKEQQRVFVWNDPDDVGDDINLIHTFLQCTYGGHTAVSRWALQFYTKYRSTNLGMTELGEKNPIMGAIAWNHRNDQSDLVELYRPVIERVFV